MRERTGGEFDSLLRSPLWRPRDLGRPLPATPHANSVCLPLWDDVVAYEQSEPRVMRKLQTGYPRFFIHPMVERFFQACADRFAKPGEFCHAYPSEASADRALASVRKWTGVLGRIEVWDRGGPTVTCFPQCVAKEARKHWRHSGEGISSRRAEALLSGAAESSSEDSRVTICERISHWLGVAPDCVYLCCSGMSAIYAVYRAAQRLSLGARSAQFGFSYVDTLRVQRDVGVGVHFFPRGDREDLDRLESLLKTERVSAIFTEFPCNPLLSSPDLHRLFRVGSQHRVPLVVDETLGSYVNVDVLPACDVLVTSLTKYFTGLGDVMAGAIVLNPEGRMARSLRSALDAEHEDTIWGADAVRLAEASATMVERVQRINRTAERLCGFLRGHPRVAEVDYPKYRDAENYQRFRRDGGGFGGLFSILLRDPARTSAPFYDSLRVSKGPNLGTYFSLACPFTLLAHFDELDFVERCGVSRYLIRVSVGLEDPDDLIDRFSEALARST